MIVHPEFWNYVELILPVLEFLGILFSASHVVEVDSSEEHKNYDSGQNDDENHVNNASLAVVSLVALEKSVQFSLDL